MDKAAAASANVSVVSNQVSGRKPAQKNAPNTAKKANKIVPVPEERLQGDQDTPKRMPELEKEHVHKLYNDISEHWSHTRYKPWPNVVDFLQSLPSKSLVVDVGCGNGKYLAPALEAGAGFVLGTDLSVNLLDLAIQKVEKWGGHDRPWDSEQQNQAGGRHAGRKHDRNGDLLTVSNEEATNPETIRSDRDEQMPDSVSKPCDAAVGDIVHLPIRDKVADGAVCIAVLHHLSTRDRRILALKEIHRILAKGAKALVYAWAQEQEANSRREFPTQDCYVPWHFRQQGKSYTNGESGDFTVQRFCHVFVKGEIEGLVDEVEGLEVERTYFDKGNWCVIMKSV